MTPWLAKLRAAAYRDQRRLSLVPLPVWLLFACAVLWQTIWAGMNPRTAPAASDLAPPPTVAAVHISSLGEPLAWAKLANLSLQTYDNQPGISLPFKRLDYARIEAWLTRILELDPYGQYPLLAASRLYGAVEDPMRQRRMLDFVQRQFLLDPNRRWQWLAHAAFVARHQLKDLSLAVRYAESLRLHARSPRVPAWARQMEIFMRVDMNEYETAKLLLGALLASGEVSDPSEFRFLSGRLAELQATADTTPPSGVPLKN